jgi:DNA-binding MarR family transcriptional regulator
VAAEWSFLTNHGKALLVITHAPDARLKDVAEALGVTERTAFALVRDLTDAGYLKKQRDGRRIRYEVQEHLPLPDSTVRGHTIGDVLAMLAR